MCWPELTGVYTISGKDEKNACRLSIKSDKHASLLPDLSWKKACKKTGSSIKNRAMGKEREAGSEWEGLGTSPAPAVTPQLSTRRGDLAGAMRPIVGRDIRGAARRGAVNQPPATFAGGFAELGLTRRAGRPKTAQAS